MSERRGNKERWPWIAISSRRVVVLSAAFATVLALLAIYIGRQVEPYGEFPLSALSLSFGFSIAIACFKALMYIQQRAAQLPMSCLPIPGDGDVLLKP